MIALEATGGYETVVAATLAGAGLPVMVVNPAQVRAFAQAFGKRAKTDPIDASVIARFVEATQPAVRPLPDADTRHLADLVARRRQIIDMIVAERQRQKRLTAKRLQKSIARLLAALQKELSALETDIDDAVRGSPAWRAKADLLASVPGVGKIVARTLIAELPELGRSIGAGSRRSPVSPRGPASPASGRARASSAAVGQGCAPPCSWRPWSAPATTRCSRRSDRLLAAGKPKIVALIAIARKLLTILNAIVRDGQTWKQAEHGAASN